MTKETNSLIERLRQVGWDTWEQCVTGIGEDECHEAADRIEALSAECEALQRDLAAIPCQTRGAEDLEPGCCAPCRARTTLQQTNKEGARD